MLVIIWHILPPQALRRLGADFSPRPPERETGLITHSSPRHQSVSPRRLHLPAALQFLPDILHYDLTKPIAYPNGRKPIDDVYSYRFAWLTYGKVPPQGLKPHADLLTDFPYLGPPSPSHS